MAVVAPSLLWVKPTPCPHHRRPVLLYHELLSKETTYTGAQQFIQFLLPSHRQFIDDDVLEGIQTFDSSMIALIAVLRAHFSFFFDARIDSRYTSLVSVHLFLLIMRVSMHKHACVRYCDRK